MERAALVTVDFGKDRTWSAEERSLELRELARSSGVKVVIEEIANRHEPSPAFFIGKGKAEELQRTRADEAIDVVIFNNDLTGSQQKNLEDMIGAKTIDRTQLILDIFARRARSNEGKIQVELAQLLYLLPRLTGKGIYLSRLGGGIGTRGPGEQKLEVDRRRIRSRITHLKKMLEDLRQRRSMMRKKRERFSILTSAIIGYTNAGKSTLLNALTNSNVVVEDKLFSTLDPTVRRLILPNRQKVLFIDTVGFLEDIPHHLIEAFKATLEEVVEADLLLHVVDISHPKASQQAEAVYRVLDEIGAKDKPVVTVLNKRDKLEDVPSVITRAKENFNTSCVISAIKKEGFDELIRAITSYAAKLTTLIKIKLPVSDAKTLNLIYENGLVINKVYEGDSVSIEAEVPLRIKGLLGL
ncbi:MAG: GTPase HflX [Omnitrophica bacterium RIFCSPLOWO2_01_FULL_45_10]|nr:MAG: GTPase HflX [Omnitrophica bacterium RIFCSPLOWO2_01_FULL_45_10]